MITKSIIRKIYLLAVVLIVTLPISAQNTPDNARQFLDILAYVPDIPDARAELYYADIDAALQTRPNVPQISSVEEWNATDENLQSAWLFALPTALPRFRSYLLPIIQDGYATTGLDIFKMKQTVAFGQLPDVGNILAGDFDNDAIVSTYTSNGWEIERDDDDLTLICSERGCDEGDYMDFAERNVANPFGGEFGLKQPIALTDGFIFNSADLTRLQGILNTRIGDFPSLADAPDIQTAAFALAEQGFIRQAIIFPHDSVNTVDFVGMSLGEEVNVEQIQAYLSTLREVLIPVPTSRLMLIAETANLEAETQAGHMVFIYSSEEIAQSAADALQSNLEADTIHSTARGIPYSEVISNVGELNIQVIENAETEFYAVLVSIEAPLFEIDLEDVASDLGDHQFNLWLDFIFRRDTVWMAASVPDMEN